MFFEPRMGSGSEQIAYQAIRGLSQIFKLITTISKFSNLIGHQQAWFQP